MPIKIQIVDDVAQFLRGAGKAEDALDDVADSLDDLARDAQRRGKDAGDDLAKGIDRGTEKAEDSVGDLEKSFRDMARDASRYSKDAGDDIGRNVDRGVGRAGEVTGEFKDEARQNFSEVVSSFDGSMESVADLAQGTFGGLAGSLAGPMGLVAGLGAAAFGAWFAQAQENAEKIEDRVATMFDDLLESGSQYLSKSFVQEELAKIYQGADDAAIAYEELGKVAEETGLTQAQVAAAFAGDAHAGKLLTDALADAQVNLKEKHADRANAVDIFAAEEEMDLDRVQKKWEQQQKAIDIARGKVQEYGDAAEVAQLDTANAAKTTQQALDDMANKLSTLPASKRVRLEADTTALDRELARPRSIRVGVMARPGLPQPI